MATAEKVLAALPCKCETVVDVATFQALLVSRRRMVRADRRDEHLRGLQDLDTGEVFLIDSWQLTNRRIIS